MDILDSVVHLIVCIMLLWSFFEVGSCLGGSACSVWILVVFLFFGLFCCTCFLFLLVSLLVVAWLVWLFAINRTTIPRICSCSELVCAIVDLGIVGLSVMCAQCGHNLFIYLCKT